MISQVLRYSGFRNLWLAQIFSQIAINMMAFVLIIRVYETTKMNTAVAGLALMIGLPSLVFGMLAGVLVDRWKRKKVLIFCNLSRALLVLGFWLSSETLIWVYVLAFCASVITQFFVPAEAPTIPRVVPRHLILPANSLFTLTYYGSMISGYMFSGPALKIFGPENVFLLISGMLLTAVLWVSFLPREGIREKKNSGIRPELIKGWTFIKRNEKVRTGIFLLIMSQSLIAVLGALAPGFADTVLAVEVRDISFLMLGPAAVGMAAGALIIGQYGEKWQRKKMMNWGILTAGILILILSISGRMRGMVNPVASFFPVDRLHFAMFLIFLLGGANALIDVPSTTALQEETTEEIRGRVYGVLTSFVGGAGILPVVMAGVLADLAGVGKVMTFMGILICGYGMIRQIKNRKCF